MSSRQARRQRREAERRNRKAELKREKAATLENGQTLVQENNNAPVQEHSAQESSEAIASPSARVLANRANAQLSTGPQSELGRAIVSQNNFRHGLRGVFKVLPTESQEDFDTLIENLIDQNTPANPAEAALIEKMAQHSWLSQRAVLLQDTCFENGLELSKDGRQNLALYLRYQITHDRAFYKCSDELRKLRAEKRKTENGFERQQREEAELELKKSVDKRKQDHHKWDLRMAQAAYEHQELKNSQSTTPKGAPIAAYSAS